MILYNSDEARIGKDSNSWILSGVVFGYCQGPIRAAIVDNGIFPVLERLCQHALDTLRKIFLSVINGSKNRHKWNG